MNSQKGSAKVTLLVVLVVVVAAVLVYFAFLKKPGEVAVNPTPTPAATANPTANWKTYTNTKYGFEIKYPAQQWLVKTANDIVNISLDRPNSESPTVQVTVSDQTATALADQILADVKADPIQKLISDKMGSFAGVASREITYTPTAGGQATFILLSRGGKTFQLLKLDTGEENQDLGEIFSTFKFTK